MLASVSCSHRLRLEAWREGRCRETPDGLAVQRRPPDCPERGRETERQTHRHTDTHTQRERETERQRGREAERQKDREGGMEGGREGGRERSTEAGRRGGNSQKDGREAAPAPSAASAAPVTDTRREGERLETQQPDRTACCGVRRRRPVSAKPLGQIRMSK